MLMSFSSVTYFSSLSHACICASIISFLSRKTMIRIYKRVDDISFLFAITSFCFHFKLILFFGYVHRFAKTSISFEFITIVELLLPSSFMYPILQKLCECVTPSILWHLLLIHDIFSVQALQPDVGIK
jgi:hypothetical protein